MKSQPIRTPIVVPRFPVSDANPRATTVVVPRESRSHARLLINSAALGQANGDMFFELGMMYSTGRSGPTDLVTAHKWFNIAAMRGNPDAVRLRREIAAEMSAAEVAAAQRAARDWLAQRARSQRPVICDRQSAA